MIINIMSLFRNNAGSYIDDYFERIERLEQLIPRHAQLRLILGYGDSTDGTGEQIFEICSNRYDAHIVDVSHGGKKWGSVESVERFKNLSFAGNKLLQCLKGLNHRRKDCAVFIESDLIWRSSTLLYLLSEIEHLENDLTLIAPMIMEINEAGEYNNLFYDVFAFRRRGIRFTKKFPHHPDLWTVGAEEQGFLEVDSIGSFVAGKVFPFLQFSFPEEGEGGAIVGFCNNVRAGGGQIYVDKMLSVYHPV